MDNFKPFFPCLQKWIMNKKIVTIGNTDQGFSFSHNQTQLSLSLIKFQFFICHYLYFLIVPYSFKIRALEPHLQQSTWQRMCTKFPTLVKCSAYTCWPTRFTELKRLQGQNKLSPNSTAFLFPYEWLSSVFVSPSHFSFVCCNPHLLAVYQLSPVSVSK